MSACLLAVLASLRPPRHSLRVQDLTLNPTSLNHKLGKDLASGTKGGALAGWFPVQYTVSNMVVSHTECGVPFFRVPKKEMVVFWSVYRGPPLWETAMSLEVSPNFGSPETWNNPQP